METLTLYLIAIPALLILSVVASKGAGRFGIPALSMFLLIGMVVGREGPGGVPFSNYLLAQTLGIIALIQILHSGGLSTRLEDVRTVRWSALVFASASIFLPAKKRINTHRFVPAQFNEFYPKCPRPRIGTLPKKFSRAGTTDRSLFLFGSYVMRTLPPAGGNIKQNR